MMQYELVTYLRKNSRKHNSKSYFNTLEEAQEFCTNGKIKNYIIKEVELMPTSNPTMQTVRWSYGNYYYKSF